MVLAVERRDGRGQRRCQYVRHTGTTCVDGHLIRGWCQCTDITRRARGEARGNASANEKLGVCSLRCFSSLLFFSPSSTPTKAGQGITPTRLLFSGQNLWVPWYVPACLLSEVVGWDGGVICVVCGVIRGRRSWEITASSGVCALVHTPHLLPRQSTHLRTRRIKNPASGKSTTGHALR